MKSAKYLLIIFIIPSYSLIAAADTSTSQITLVTKEAPLAKFEEETRPLLYAIVSPDNRRIVYGGELEKQPVKPGDNSYYLVNHCAMINGVPGKRYDSVNVSDIGCKFSPNGKRLAYVAGTKEKKNFVVLDGVEGPGGCTTGFRLVFSPDSKQFANTGWNNDAKKDVVFLNGEKVGEYRGVDDLVFSPDGKRLAYWASTNEGKHFVVADGKEGKYYDSVSGLVFSQDSKHVMYNARSGGKGIIVKDEIEIAESNSLQYSVFSPDGNRMACVFKEGDKKYVVADGNRGKLYANITGLIFSPNSKRYAYAAWYDHSMCAVIDGVEQKSYEWVMNISFSPDSNRAAYSAGPEEEDFKCCVVVDGVEGKRYGSIPDAMFPEGISPPVFSPDSKSVGYVVFADNKCRMVVNGVEGKYYDEIRKETIGGWSKWDKSFVFGPDGKVAYWAKIGINTPGFIVRGPKWLKDKWMVVVNGVESKDYDGYPLDSRLVFENPNLHSFVAFRDMTMFLVEIEIK
jgi:WD40 repeat protein